MENKEESFEKFVEQKEEDTLSTNTPSEAPEEEPSPAKEGILEERPEEPKKKMEGWGTWDYWKAGVAAVGVGVGAVAVGCGVAKAAKRLSSERWRVEWHFDTAAGVANANQHQVQFTLHGPLPGGAEVVYHIVNDAGEKIAHGSVQVGRIHTQDLAYCNNWPVTLEVLETNDFVPVQNGTAHKSQGRHKKRE